MGATDPPQRPRRRLLTLVGALASLSAVVAAGPAPALAAGPTPALTSRPGRPRLLAGEVYGIDVSSHQGVVDWPRVADAGIGFVYIKATQGSTYVDPYFRSDWSGAGQAHLGFGAYAYFSFCSTGLEQADTFLRVVPRAAGALPPALDIELKGNCTTRPPPAIVASQIQAFVRTVDAGTNAVTSAGAGTNAVTSAGGGAVTSAGAPATSAGAEKSVIFYVGRDFARRYPGVAAGLRPRWRRQASRPAAGQAVIWQPVPTASIAGIDGPVDLDVARLATLRAFHRPPL